MEENQQDVWKIKPNPESNAMIAASFLAAMSDTSHLGPGDRDRSMFIKDSFKSKTNRLNRKAKRKSCKKAKKNNRKKK